MDSTSNAFSYAVGGLALFSTLASVLLYSRTYLPGAQMKVLDDLLVETRQIYEKASTEGLLPPDVSSVAYFKLLRFESEGDTLREITYRALSSFDKLWDLFRGHTTKIMRLANNVGALRAMLMSKRKGSSNSRGT
ncbi:hypothetical protein BDZ94DRAFT_757675 [Collybia nuda]|uniref:Uncharacterized protein n=1 Tax=Collybia nuda TaxID=64659 RepID=A0A9P5Y6C6_9AGAR|nr:hypothetical protein BDZ94DRAFT_757675 [Collybia nuda]